MQRPGAEGRARLTQPTWGRGDGCREGGSWIPYGKLCPKAMRSSTCGKLVKCPKMSYFHPDLCRYWVKRDGFWKPLWGEYSCRCLAELVIVPELWEAEEQPTGWRWAVSFR